LTLARLSLDQTATLEELSRSAQDARAAIDDLRALPRDGLAPGNLTLGQALRNDETLRNTLVIIASTESSHTRIQRLRLMGAEFIHKPFRPEDLASVVARVAALRS
jgi:CheY-like chemotaxis protein